MASKQWTSVGLWLVQTEGAGPDAEPLFIPGTTLVEVEQNFRKWDDMGYKIISAKRVGRVAIPEGVTT